MTIDLKSGFIAENGLYLSALRAFESPVSFFRNFLLAHKLGVKKIKIGAHARLNGLSYIKMGEDFEANEGLWLDAISRYHDQEFSPRIAIGNRVRISQWVHIAATNSIDIGDDVLIGSKVVLIDHNHGQYSGPHTDPAIPPALRPLDRDKEIVIGRGVWLGDGVVVTAGSIVGERSIIGANSVVRGEIPPYVMAAGAPAKVIRQFDSASCQWTNVRPAT